MSAALDVLVRAYNGGFVDHRVRPSVYDDSTGISGNDAYLLASIGQPLTPARRDRMHAVCVRERRAAAAIDPKQASEALRLIDVANANVDQRGQKPVASRSPLVPLPYSAPRYSTGHDIETYRGIVAAVMYVQLENHLKPSRNPLTTCPVPTDEELKRLFDIIVHCMKEVDEDGMHITLGELYKLSRTADLRNGLVVDPVRMAELVVGREERRSYDAQRVEILCVSVLEAIPMGQRMGTRYKRLWSMYAQLVETGRQSNKIRRVHEGGLHAQG